MDLEKIVREVVEEIVKEELQKKEIESKEQQNQVINDPMNQVV